MTPLTVRQKHQGISTRKPVKTPPMKETITSLVIIVKMIVSNGIAIDTIP